MKVCIVTSQRFLETPGGEQKFSIQLGKWLVSHGITTIIVGRTLMRVTSTKPTEIVKTSLQPYKTLHLPQALYFTLMILVSFLQFLITLKIAHTNRIDVIHAQDTGYGGLASLLAAKFLHIPLIVSSHGTRYFTLTSTKQNKSFFPRLFILIEYCVDRIVCTNADFVHCVSASQISFFRRMGINKKRIVVLPVAIDFNDFVLQDDCEIKNVKNELGISNTFCIGYIGRLSREKGIGELIKGFSRTTNDPLLRLVIVGDGPEKTRLKQMCRDIGISEAVIFTGARSDVSRILNAIDIFAITSLVEGLPIALLEAMACGKAIIASDIPAIREIVEDKKEALLVNPMDVCDINKGILSLYKNLELREELGNNAKKRAREYDANIIYPKFLKNYRKILLQKSK